MKLKDCILLGSAKLRLRRRRTVISCLVISLLFGLIVMVLTVSGAYFNSMAKMSGEVFDGKVYLQVAMGSQDPYNDKSVWERAVELYAASEDIDKENPIYIEGEGDNEYEHLDIANEFALRAIDEYYLERLESAGENVKAKVEPYGGRVMADGLRKYSVKEGTMKSDKFPNGWFGSVRAPGDSLDEMDTYILRNFLTTDTVRDDAVPIVVTADAAERLLGIEALKSGAPNKERYERFLEIRERATGFTFANGIFEELLSTGDDELDADLPEPEKIGEVKYQIVGVVSAGGFLLGTDRDIGGSIIEAFFGTMSTSQYNWSLVPESYINNYTETTLEETMSYAVHYVEFDKLSDAEKFMEKNRCMPYCGKGTVDIGEYMTNQTMVKYHGDAVNRIVSVLALFFGIFAIFVMMGVFSRIIGEERQATAIYRAVGASKGDIRKVYLTYAVMLSGITAILALLVGWIGATVVHFIYSAELTYGARTMYGLVTDTNVWLIGFDWRIILVVLIMMMIGVLSCLAYSDKAVGKSIVSDLKE